MTSIEVAAALEAQGFTRQKPDAEWSHYRKADGALADVQTTRWAMAKRRDRWRGGYSYNGLLPETQTDFKAVLRAVGCKEAPHDAS